jgi:hypothetical protein
MIEAMSRHLLSAAEVNGSAGLSAIALRFKMMTPMAPAVSPLGAETDL